jgi:hypothetical protein
MNNFAQMIPMIVDYLGMFHIHFMGIKEQSNANYVMSLFQNVLNAGSLINVG